MCAQPLKAPRIDPLPEEQAREQLGDRGRPLNIFLTLAKHQPLFSAFGQLGGYLLGRQATIPRRERELVILRVGWRSGSAYEFGQHTVIGKQIGLTDDEISRLTRESLSGWADDDATLLAMADELCADNEVSDQTWARLAARWSEQQLLELLILGGFYRLVSGFLRSVGVQLEPGTPGFPEGAS